MLIISITDLNTKMWLNRYKIYRRLEAKAQEYAETLAAEDQGLNHCKLPSCDREGAGENLAMAWGSTSAETNATKAW